MVDRVNINKAPIEVHKLPFSEDRTKVGIVELSSGQLNT